MGKSGLESKGKTLGVFTLIMINVSLILNLRYFLGETATVRTDFD